MVEAVLYRGNRRKTRGFPPSELNFSKEEEMRKLWLTGLLLLACSAWVAAQTSSSSNSSGSAGTSASSSSTSEPGNSSSGTASPQTSQSGTSNESTAPKSSEIRETSIQGCLEGSSGNYTLTDQLGNVHTLQGDNAKLSQHIGQEIEVKGYQVSANNATSPSGSTPSSTSGTTSSSVSMGESPAAFQVNRITKIAITCTTRK